MLSKSAQKLSLSLEMSDNTNAGRCGGNNAFEELFPDPAKDNVREAWERADEMMAKHRGLKDKTPAEVKEYLASKPNPFVPLSEEEQRRTMEAFEAQDVEALAKMDHVQVYETYVDQRKREAKEAGVEYEKYQKGQLILDAKTLWNYFVDLRALYEKHKDDNEAFEKAIQCRKWQQFLMWYPTIFGMARSPDPQGYHIDTMRMMVEQKHMMETNPAYTEEYASAAMHVHHYGEWMKNAPRIVKNAEDASK